MLSRGFRGLERLAPTQMANARLNGREQQQRMQFQQRTLPVNTGHSWMRNTFGSGDTENHDPMAMLPEKQTMVDAVDIHDGFNDATGRTPGMLSKGASGISDAFSIGQAYNDRTTENMIGGVRGAAGIAGGVLGKNLMGPLGNGMSIWDGVAAAANQVSPVKIPDSNQVAAGTIETGGKGVADIQQHLPGAMENVI